MLAQGQWGMIDLVEKIAEYFFYLVYLRGQTPLNQLYVIHSSGVRNNGELRMEMKYFIHNLPCTIYLKQGK